MNKHDRSYVLYTMGLNEKELLAVSSHYNTVARTLSPEENISHLQQNSNNGVLWISLDSWLKLSMEKRLGLSGISKILILPFDANITHLDEFGSLGFSSILIEPLQANKIREAKAKALEAHSIYQDIHRMSREIMLERELLERKNANLSFLVSFLSSTSGLLLPEEILNVAKETLNELLPIHSLGAFIWLYDEATNEDKEFMPCMFIPAKENTNPWNVWKEALLNATSSISKQKYNNYETFPLRIDDAIEKTEKNPELSIALPLQIKDQSIGIVIINMAEEFPLGRDNIEVLESSMSHMALAMRNTWLYKKIKTQSERDSLTSLYNRRHFDATLELEIKRHERYGHELGLILLDIDYFKSINDTYGHPAGDQVLKEIGKIIVDELRTADCISRYGGEEFLMLLPYTSAEQSWILAERLRDKIQIHNFCNGKLAKNITASFGVTGFRAGLDIDSRQLVNQADIALYRAKKQGRNCSVLELISPNIKGSSKHIQTLSA